MFTTSDQMLQCPQRPLGMDRRWKSNTELAPNCPRCASPNTKFCYYNNYSLSQPRYFCKGCRRYWTKGGSLRNVPIGGGCRKNRRSKSTRPDRVSVGTYSVSESPASPGGILSGDPSTAPPGPDIDLAAVFAKFLKTGGEAAGCSDQPDHHVLMETHEPSDQMSQTQLQGHVPEARRDDDRRQEQEFMGHDTAASELQTLIGGCAGGGGGSEEVEQDVLWAEAATALSSFEWQPMVQLQELGQFTPEEQSKVSPVMMDDYWNTFDLSAYEVFSRP